jgi:hypothetical protein
MTFPSTSRSRWGLSALFLRIPFVNGPVTPAFVALTDVVLAVLLGLGTERPGWWFTPFAVAMVIVMAVLAGISWAFRPKEHGWFVGLLPGVVHAWAHGTWAWAGLSIAFALASADGGHKPSTGEVLLAGVVVAVGALVVFSLYFLLCDVLIHWHENEFFSGMRLEDYKSHLRISISPPSVEESAGDLRVEVLGIRRVPRQRRKQRLEAPVVEMIETFEVKPAAVSLRPSDPARSRAR